MARYGLAMKHRVTAMLRFAGLLATFAVVAPGCSSDSDDDEEPAAGSGGVGGSTGGTSPTGGTSGANPTGGRGGSGAGGTPSTGGSSTGGTNPTGGSGSGTGGTPSTGGTNPTGGSSGAGGNTGGSAGSTPGMHCAPGTTYENFRAYVEAGGPISNCQGYDPTLIGIPASEQIYVRSIALASPLPAGGTMAISIDWIAGGASLEFWGASEICGDGSERLGTGQSLAPNITCVTLSGGTMSHSHVLMVWRNGGGQHGDVTICPTGTCSP